jgi:hypothetical protein
MDPQLTGLFQFLESMLLAKESALAGHPIDNVFSNL